MSDEDTNPIVAQFPTGGLALGYAQDEQPETTTIDLLNCWAFDPHGRLRGSQRPGTSTLWSGDLGATALSSGTAISTESASVVTATTETDSLVSSSGTGSDTDAESLTTGGESYQTPEPPSSEVT